MPTTPKNTYLDLSDKASGGGQPITLWWTEKEPDRIHLILTDDRLVDSAGEKPGLRLVLSSNPKSADYSPANFNRCARLLRGKGMPAPAEDVEENPRHLRYRDALIARITDGTKPPTATSGVLPEQAVHCDICYCWVSDLEVHVKAVHG